MTKSASFITFDQAASNAARSDCHLFDVKALKNSLRYGAASQQVNKQIIEATPRFLPTISMRFAKRVLRKPNKNSKRSEFLTPFSLCHLIYVELCTWIPIRTALRNYSFSDEIRTVIIPLSRELFNVCRLWKEENHLFEFYLGYELSKKYSVVFSIPDNSNGLLEFNLAPDLISCRFLFGGNKLFCTKHARGIHKALGIVFGDEAGNRVTDFVLAEENISTNTPRKISVNVREFRFDCFNVDVIDDIFRIIFTALFDSIEERADITGKFLVDLIAKENLNDLYVSDHPNFEAGLVAKIIARSGGTITLWPHSSIPIRSWEFAFEDHPPKRRFQVVKSRSNQPTDSLEERVMSGILFNYPVCSALCDEDVKLTVVIIGTHHCIRDMSVIDYDAHSSLYQELVSGLFKSAKDIRVFFRPKKEWETLNWFASVVGREVCEAPLPPEQYDIPNTVFVSVSNYTSALSEGVIRGIHCITVEPRKVPSEFTYPVMEVIPGFTVVEAIEHIERCADQDYYQSVWLEQRKKFLEATEF